MDEKISSAASSGFGGRHAVVIGGSMAGMLASRALAPHFERVTLIERDRLPQGPELRKGCPQEQQPHGLLDKAVEIIEGYFPGVFQELVAAGSTIVDMSEVTWFRGGIWQARSAPGLKMYVQTRTLLDSVIRSRVVGQPNIQVLDDCEVLKPVLTANRSAVRGVELRRRHQEGTEVLEADVVVDASGRGSRMPRWLEELGLPRVEETQLRIDVGYASRKCRKPKHVADWKAMAIYPTPPHEKRMGALAPIEGDTWLVTQAGVSGDYPPMDDAGYLEYARSLPQPQFYEMLKRSEPLTPLVAHKFPSDMRRHYERLPNMPEGLVVMGDALCSFNPLYGQGMTVAALGAVTLGETLAAQPRRELSGLSRRFHQKAAAMLQLPWTIATSEDLNFPSVEGPRPLWWKMMQGFSGRLQAQAVSDSVVSTTFANVMHMRSSPLAMAAPHMLLRALRSPPTGAGIGRTPVMDFTETSPASSPVTSVVG